MEQNDLPIAELIKKSAGELALSIPDDAIPYFCTYLNELKKWNKAINLTAILDDQEVVVKHFSDSLAGLKVIDITDQTELLDVGAGAGFPSIPMKFVRPELSIEMLEPNEKKGSFLRYLIGSLGLRRATVATAKLENYVSRENNRRLFDYIVVRAFRVDTLGLALGRMLKVGGKLVLFRAAKVDRHFKLETLSLDQEVEYELPSGYGHRTLSVFSMQAG